MSINSETLLDFDSNSLQHSKTNGSTDYQMDENTSKEFDDLLDFGNDTTETTTTEEFKDSKRDSNLEKYAEEVILEALDQSRKSFSPSPERVNSIIIDKDLIEKAEARMNIDNDSENIFEESIEKFTVSEELNESDDEKISEESKRENIKNLELSINSYDDDTYFTETLKPEENAFKSEVSEEVCLKEISPSPSEEKIVQVVPVNNERVADSTEEKEETSYKEEISVDSKETNQTIDFNSLIPSDSITSDLSESLINKNVENVEEPEQESLLDSFQASSVSLVQDLTAEEEDPNADERNNKFETENSLTANDESESSSPSNTNVNEDSYILSNSIQNTTEVEKESKSYQEPVMDSASQQETEVKLQSNFSIAEKSAENHSDENKETKDVDNSVPKSPKIVRKQEKPKAFDNMMTSQANSVCSSCSKRAYPVEIKQVDGVVFHKNCFRCTTCNCQLSNNFSKLDKTFYCTPHYKEMFKRKGKYEVCTDVPNLASNNSVETERSSTEKIPDDYVENFQNPGKLNSDNFNSDENDQKVLKTEISEDEKPKSGSVRGLLSAWTNINEKSSDNVETKPVKKTNSNVVNKSPFMQRKSSSPAELISNDQTNGNAKNGHNDLEDTDTTDTVQSSSGNTDKDELKSISLPSTRSLRTMFEKEPDKTSQNERVVNNNANIKKIENVSKFERKAEADTKPLYSPPNNKPISVINNDAYADNLNENQAPDDVVQEMPTKGSVKNLLAMFNR